MIRSLLAIISMVLFACQNINQLDSTVSVKTIVVKDTTLDLRTLTITIPNTWQLANDDTLPKVADVTARYRIVLPNKKLVLIQHGLSAWDRSEVEISPVKDKEIYLKNNLDSAYTIFSDHPKAINPKRLKIHEVGIAKISGLQAKIFEPLNLNHGFTGVYIDSAGVIKPVGKYGFSMFAEGLDSTLSKELIKAIKTIKLKPLE